MNRIDLHGYKLDEGLKAFIDFYNKALGKHDTLRIVHGYGSGGDGGKLCDRLRQLFDEHTDKLDIIKGEDLENNPGLTIVFPKEALPTYVDQLTQEILDFCEIARVQEKIINKFHKHGDKKVLQLLKSLEKQKRLRSGMKGKYTTWLSVKC